MLAALLYSLMNSEFEPFSGRADVRDQDLQSNCKENTEIAPSKCVCLDGKESSMGLTPPEEGFLRLILCVCVVC